MEKISVSLIFIMSLFHENVNAQVVNPSYEVATWKGFAQAAVSYTWDDNTPKQLTDALPLYDLYGFKVTFFTITSTNPNWNGLKMAQNNGHEIASHTVTHTALNTLTDSTQEVEQKKAKEEINAQLSTNNCTTVAYPYCAAGNKSITGKYYISARGCSGVIENKTPADFLNVSSIICGTQGAVRMASQFNGVANNAATSNGWVVFLLHGINNDGGYSPVDSADLRIHLQYMNASRDKYWVNTYGNVVRYIRERDAAAVTELSNTDSLIVFSVTHNLDVQLYNFPLTIKRPVPGNWISFTVSQNGTMLPTQIVNENGKTYFIVDILPNGGDVKIRNTKVTDIEAHDIVSSFTIKPNPFHSFTNVSFSLEKAGDVSLELLDASGNKIYTIAKGLYASGLHEFTLDGTSIKGNIFYCLLHVNECVYTTKIIR